MLKEATQIGFFLPLFSFIGMSLGWESGFGGMGTECDVVHCINLTNNQ